MKLLSPVSVYFSVPCGFICSTLLNWYFIVLHGQFSNTMTNLPEKFIFSPGLHIMKYFTLVSPWAYKRVGYITWIPSMDKRCQFRLWIYHIFTESDWTIVCLRFKNSNLYFQCLRFKNSKLCIFNVQDLRMAKCIFNAQDLGSYFHLSFSEIQAELAI